MNMNANADTVTSDKLLSNNSAQPTEPIRDKQAELEARGKKLREFFEPYIKRANGKENWKFHLGFENEAYDFFPKGMTFEDATILLKSAGFQVIPRPIPDEKIKFNLLATLTFPNRYIYETLVAIELEPTEQRIDNVQVKKSYISIGVN